MNIFTAKTKSYEKNYCCGGDCYCCVWRVYFKSATGAGESKIALLGMVYKSSSEGFFITYGDGTTEKIPFKMKMITDAEYQMEIQAKTAEIHQLLAQKGYYFTGTQNLYSSVTSVFEKR